MARRMLRGIGGDDSRYSVDYAGTHLGFTKASLLRLDDGAKKDRRHGQTSACSAGRRRMNKKKHHRPPPHQPPESSSLCSDHPSWPGGCVSSKREHPTPRHRSWHVHQLRILVSTVGRRTEATGDAFPCMSSRSHAPRRSGSDPPSPRSPFNQPELPRPGHRKIMRSDCCATIAETASSDDVTNTFLDPTVTDAIRERMGESARRRRRADVPVRRRERNAVSP